MSVWGILVKRTKGFLDCTLWMLKISLKRKFSIQGDCQNALNIELLDQVIDVLVDKFIY